MVAKMSLCINPLDSQRVIVTSSEKGSHALCDFENKNGTRIFSTL